jgi:Carboxypeptidase regulatory-like domain
MKRILLALFIAQVTPPPVGVVTGVVRNANGTPASGVRVYAIGAQALVEDLANSPLEGLTQTDSMGRFRLEIASGRYYIATGSVNTPTFYPGTTSITSARVVGIPAGGLVESIDFSSFVPAPAPPLGALRGAAGSGTLSGTLRFPDGSPASSMAVAAVPASAVLGALAPKPVSLARGTPATPKGATTDAAGRYVLQNLPDDTYYIAAGFAESAVLYPGVTNVLVATSIATTRTTNMTSLDFTLTRPRSGVSVSGRVAPKPRASAVGVTVEIQNPSEGLSAYGLPTSRPTKRTSVDKDGGFQFTGISPGLYVLEASYPGGRTERKTIVVADSPLAGLDF